MIVSKQIPDRIKRASRSIGYAIWLDASDYYLGLVPILRARLSDTERVGLAFAALKSLDHDDAEAAFDVRRHDRRALRRREDGRRPPPCASAGGR